MQPVDSDAPSQGAAEELERCRIWHIRIRCCPDLEPVARLSLLRSHCRACYWERAAGELLTLTGLASERCLAPEDLGRLFISLLFDARERQLPAPEVEWTLSTSFEWPEGVRATWPTVPLGTKLEIRPSWAPEASQDAERLVVRIEPGLAFGNGWHTSTQLSLEAMEREFAAAGNWRPAFAADIGCGSGILSLCALRLGAVQVRAVDTDPLAVRATRRNGELNGFLAPSLIAETGSIDKLKSLLPGPVDVFFCNICAEVILSLVPAFGALTHARSWGVLSGIRGPAAPLLHETLGRHGWRVAATSECEGWQCLVVRRCT